MKKNHKKNLGKKPSGDTRRTPGCLNRLRIGFSLSFYHDPVKAGPGICIPAATNQRSSLHFFRDPLYHDQRRPYVRCPGSGAGSIRNVFHENRRTIVYQERVFLVWQRIRFVWQLLMRIRHNSGLCTGTGSIISAPVTAENSFLRTQKGIHASTRISALSLAGRRADQAGESRLPHQDEKRQGTFKVCDSMALLLGLQVHAEGLTRKVPEVLSGFRWYFHTTPIR